MLIREVIKVTALTKKAIEYYLDKGFISPITLANGYRDFSADDVETLKKISVLRKLGLTTEEVRAVLSDKTTAALQKLSIQKGLHMQQQQLKKDVLDKLCQGKSYGDIAKEVESIAQNATIAEKLLDAFPGYYGRFICMHFSRFLNEPIITHTQQKAYGEILSFLDGVPPLTFPEDLQSYLLEGTKHITTQNIADLFESLNQMYRDPDQLLTNNKDLIEEYLAFKQSDAYRDSPAFKIMVLTKEFYSTNGYYDIFIPAMKTLSAAYASYHAQIEIANETFVKHYPHAAALNS